MNSEDIVRIENLSNKNDTFIIRWNITYLCNYNCDFCIQGNKKQHIEKSKGESIEIRNKICNNLITFIEEKINKIFRTKGYAFNIPVEITFSNKTVNTYLALKKNDSIITLDNEVIPISTITKLEIKSPSD